MSATNVPKRGRNFIPAMALLGALAPTAFFGLPQLVALSAQQWGFGDSQLGIAVFLEIGGNAVGTLAVAFVLSQWPVRRLLTLGVLLAVVSNLATSQIQGIQAYCAVRLCAGIASGMLSGIAMRYLSFSENSDRNFGYLVIAQTLWSMVLLGWLLPAIGDQWVASGSYVFVALTPLYFLSRLGDFAPDEPLAPPKAEGGAVHRLGAYTVLFALFSMYVGVGVMWTFVDQIGQRAGYSRDFISTVLAGANLAAAFPCLLLPRLMAARGPYGLCLIMLSGCALAVAAMALPMTPGLFILSVVLFVATWAGAAMLIFSTVPQYDGVGRYTALSPGFLGVGYGVGSITAGQLLEQGQLQSAIALSSLSCIAAVIIYSFIRRIPPLARA
ncbi:MAG TPA: MFS transporter [Rhodocyclaceae bacterium]|nr:MFS transporter [Rhodocyclaceae bacterium]